MPSPTGGPAATGGGHFRFTRRCLGLPPCTPDASPRTGARACAGLAPKPGAWPTRPPWRRRLLLERWRRGRVPRNSKPCLTGGRRQRTPTGPWGAATCNGEPACRRAARPAYRRHARGSVATAGVIDVDIRGASTVAIALLEIAVFRRFDAKGALRHGEGASAHVVPPAFTRSTDSLEITHRHRHPFRSEPEREALDTSSPRAGLSRKTVATARPGRAQRHFALTFPNARSRAAGTSQSVPPVQRVDTGLWPMATVDGAGARGPAPAFLGTDEAHSAVYDTERPRSVCRSPTLAQPPALRHREPGRGARPARADIATWHGAGEHFLPGSPDEH